MAGSASLQAIANEPEWRRLLHFDAGGPFSTRSAVVDSAFFMDANGANDPVAELKATLAALRRPDPDAETPARCRFPARTRFLERNLQTRFPDAQCPKLSEWRDEHSAGRIGLTFVNGYLGNPASFFGHLLLHIDRDGSSADTSRQTPDSPALRLLDTSINFGADLPDDEAMLPYMMKGLFGGYDARFSNTNFYRNSSIYSENEMRDVWIYELELDPASRALLIDHLFEVMHQDYAYLFLSQNCASRIARTLRLAVPTLETPGSTRFWTTPESVVRGAVQARNRNENPLVKRVDYVPSRKAITQTAWQKLPAPLKRAAAAYWPTVGTLAGDDALDGLTSSQRGQVLDVMLSHSLWLASAEDGAGTDRVRSKLLRQRARLPPGNGLASPPQPRPIHEATPPGRFSLGAAGYSDGTRGLRMGGRVLQYDRLDATAPRLPSASMEVGAINLELTEQELTVRDLTLLSVGSLQSTTDNLPGIQQRRPWQADLDIQRRSIDDPDSLDLRGTLGMGAAFRRSGWLGYGLVGPQVATTFNQQGAVAASTQVGVLHDGSKGQRSHWSLTHRDSFQGQGGRRSRVAFEYRIPVAGSRDVRFGLTYDPQRNVGEGSVEIGWY